MRTSAFDYDLPDEAIAQVPAEPRDAARLLDTRDVSDHVFADLPRLLSPGDLVVVNRTRVRRARLIGEKADTGGSVEALLLRRLDEERWEALLRPARRLRTGVHLRFGEIEAEVLEDPVEGKAILGLKAPGEVEEAIERHGAMPLPPYIHRPLPEPERYQTVFASTPGSAAAPTAGLHFTPAVVEGLKSAGVSMTSVDLEVGLATFRPITSEQVESHQMHAEMCEVGEEAAAAIVDCRARGGRVVAIGTTVVRTLESRATDDGEVRPGRESTDLFIRPGHRFRAVDLLVTNFHLPRSSLLVLLAAFMGEGWRQAYETALQRGYRFLSFGDAMLCRRER